MQNYISQRLTFFMYFCMSNFAKNFKGNQLICNLQNTSLLNLGLTCGLTFSPQGGAQCPGLGLPLAVPSLPCSLAVMLGFSDW